MQRLEKELPLAEADRTQLNERVNTSAISGQKLIILTVSILAAGMILFGIGSQNNFFGVFGAEKKVAEAQKQAQISKGPKAPPIILPVTPVKKSEPDNSLLLANATTCKGGLRLPAGMPCPEDNSQTMSTPNETTGGSNNSGGNGSVTPTKANTPPAVDLIRNRKLGGEISVASTTPAQSAEQYSGVKGQGFLGETVAIRTGEKGNGFSDSIPVTYTPKAAAEINLNPSMTLSKGQMPDCNMGVAIRSSQPGFIKCMLSQPVYSMDGKVILLERGTQIEGEYRGTVKGGQSSIQAIFTRAVTPNAIVIPFDSPGTDALGRSGLDGDIDHKWIERFGGAVLSAVIEDSIDIYKQGNAGTNGNSNVISQYPNTNSSGKAITDELLKQGGQVQPELVKNQGEIVKIFIARDIDFSGVYELKKASNAK